MRGLLRWFGANRRRLAPLVLVAAVLVIGLQASQAAPHDTHVRLHLSDPHSIREVTLTYEAETTGDTTGTRWAFPQGASERLDDTHSLSPGPYSVHVDVARVGGGRRAEDRRMEVPLQGALVIDLRGSE